jgi:hypothetical protein
MDVVTVDFSSYRSPLPFSNTNMAVLQNCEVRLIVTPLNLGSGVLHGDKSLGSMQVLLMYLGTILYKYYNLRIIVTPVVCMVRC